MTSQVKHKAIYANMESINFSTVIAPESKNFSLSCPVHMGRGQCDTVGARPRVWSLICAKNTTSAKATTTATSS